MFWNLMSDCWLETLISIRTDVLESNVWLLIRNILWAIWDFPSDFPSAMFQKQYQLWGKISNCLVNNETSGSQNTISSDRNSQICPEKAFQSTLRNQILKDQFWQKFSNLPRESFPVNTEKSDFKRSVLTEILKSAQRKLSSQHWEIRF